MNRPFTALAFVSLLAALPALAQAPAAEAPAAPSANPVRQITIVNIEYKGTKIWVTATLIVRRGETVRLTLINNAPSGVHGWAADDFNIKVAVNNDPKDNKKVVEFTPTKTGLFRTYCHLHPAHVGGEILVID